MQTINLDLSIKSVLPLLHTKQGDVGRKFKAVITDSGAAYPVSSDMQLSVWYSGTSGEGNYSAIDGRSAFSISGNAVTVELITQMLQNKGGGSLCLMINAADGTQIGMWNIPYLVEPVPGMGSAAAEQHYTALSEVAANAAAAADRAEQAAEKLTTDTTLTKSGVAADAQAVGAALDAVSENFAEDLQRKAPAGYGVGEYSGEMQLIEDMDATGIPCGIYEIGSSDTANSPMPGCSGTLIVTDSYKNTRNMVQIAVFKHKNTVLIRGCSDGVWGEWEYIRRDTGWVSMELSEDFTLYNGQAYNQPRYRVSGNTVTIRGSVTPANAITSSSSDIVIATGIPEEYRPKVSEYFVCNGSVMNRWLCTVKSTGEITISKYGTTEYAEIPTGAWLAFCVTYQLGGF